MAKKAKKRRGLMHDIEQFLGLHKKKPKARKRKSATRRGAARRAKSKRTGRSRKKRR